MTNQKENEMSQMSENLLKFAAATNNELFDADYKGGEWMVYAVKTSETLEQFVESSKGWSSRCGEKRGTIAGMPYVSWTLAQYKKNQPRCSLSVIDFGEARLALACDLSVF